MGEPRCGRTPPVCVAPVAPTAQSRARSLVTWYLSSSVSSSGSWLRTSSRERRGGSPSARQRGLTASGTRFNALGTPSALGPGRRALATGLPAGAPTAGPHIFLSDVAPVPGTGDFYLITTGDPAVPATETCLYYHEPRDEFFATGEREVGKRLADAAEIGLPRRYGRALDFGCGLGRTARALAAPGDGGEGGYCKGKGGGEEERGRKAARDTAGSPPRRKKGTRKGAQTDNRRYGSRERYKDEYRRGFTQGYERGYREARYR